MKGKEACGADEWDGAADTDIERAVSASRCREPGRPSVDIDRELACGPVAQKSTESRVPHPPVAEGEHDKARQQAYSRSDGSSVVQTAARGLVSSFEWDVFISYRVAADAELVKDIFWQLNSCVVTENGKSRRIRVFWDRQCLLAGEPWEEGFSKALCSSRLVLMVMSKKAYVMEGRHNVEAIMEASPCDNVLLEACLSLFLHQTRSTAILPLFVGERSGPSGSFSHFFESGCMPMCPDLVVSEIHEKALYHLGRHTGIGQDDMPSPRTIRDTLADIIKFQGYFLQGPADSAIHGAVQYVHTCASRLVHEHEGRSKLEQMKFSSPQGLEVCSWLDERVLSCYASTFARHKLDSLYRVAHLTEAQLDVINCEMWADRSARAVEEEPAKSTLQGTRVALGEAVKSLRLNPLAAPLKVQLDNYRDSHVSSINVLGAQNQLEVVMAKAKWLGFLVLLFSVVGAIFLYQSLSRIKDLHYTVKTHSVTSFSVQLSKNASQWWNVRCNDRSSGALVCGSGAVADDPDQVVTHLFDHEAEARFVKITPWTWNGMGDENDWRTGGDLRFEILGGQQGTVDFAVVSDGPAGTAWLQQGCRNRSDEGGKPRGLWAFQEERIGEVQCCLNSPGVHICTRDGCLSGTADTGKVTWGEAKELCKTQGWRLCRRDELQRHGSFGCCDGQNRCGYDDELVWTSALGGLQSAFGRIHSADAMEDVTEVTVDLGNVLPVRGILLQGGVQEPRFLGPACLYGTWYIPTGVFGVLTNLLFWARKSPLLGVQRGVIGSFVYSILGLNVWWVCLALDSAAPSWFSGNLVCPGVSDEKVSPVMHISNSFSALPFATRSIDTIAFSCAFLLAILQQFLRPKSFIQTAVIVLCGTLAIRFFSFPPHNLVLGALCTIFALGFTMFLAVLQRHSRCAAQKVQMKDLRLYEQAWGQAGGRCSKYGKTGEDPDSTRHSVLCGGLQSTFPPTSPSKWTGGIFFKSTVTDSNQRDSLHKNLSDILHTLDKEIQDATVETNSRVEMISVREIARARAKADSLVDSAHTDLAQRDLATARAKRAAAAKEYLSAGEDPDKIMLILDQQIHRANGDAAVQSAREKLAGGDVFGAQEARKRAALEYEKSKNGCVQAHLKFIREECCKVVVTIDEARRRAAKSPDFALWRRFLFRIRAEGLGCYARTGKIRQSTADVDLLFQVAALLNDEFFSLLRGEVVSKFENARLCAGPVKRPERALQKVVRKFHRDPRCLTDIVRGVILVTSISDVKEVLEEVFRKAVIAGAEERRTTVTGRAKDRDCINGQKEIEKRFKICKIKDRFTAEEAIGYRDVCINLEVGWTVESEAESSLVFVSVDRFGETSVRTHICEVQLMLESMYSLKEGGCHSNFVHARNLVSS